jgi:hypothetical protein
MSQVLVFTNRIELKTLLEVECNLMENLSVVVKGDPDDFIALIDMFEEIEVVVLDEPSESIIAALQIKEKSIKHLLILSNEPIFFASARLFSFELIDDFFKYLMLITNQNEMKEEAYISIPLGSLVHFNSLPIDLYLKISDIRYVKSINANDEIDTNSIMMLEEKGVKDVYFEKKHNRELSTMLLNNMIKKVERSYVTVGEKLKANNEVFHTTREIVSKLGLPSRIIDVAETVVNRITDDVKKEKASIGLYLNQLRTNNDLGFSYRFAEISSFLATKIIQEMPEASQDRIKKVVFACLFSDISLTDRSHIHIRSSDDLAKLTLAQQKEVNQHAFNASEIISKSRHAPLEVEKLIKQHHGSLTGFGFQKEISIKLSPFSLCIIAAQEVAYGILIAPELKMNEIMINSKKIHSSPVLDKYFEYIEKDLNF